MQQSIVHAFDAKGTFLGVFIPAASWDSLESGIQSALLAENTPARQIKEPLGDWEMLVSCWDFPYPVDLDVRCDLCGNCTQDWQLDDPRKFILKAANLGGLVSFECTSCHARIRKNHFKDEINIQCTPSAS